ncbi:Uncharacterized protein APZ42_017372 [Daphnia magna]|uniref:Uncharacterized protein n=1 Tax=Daphnia magna TaxID=35525 RepID=A0A164ZTX0_9CRUS|nr:Uncharacterized protein APZ42_017372 [Daphnia magna]
MQKQIADCPALLFMNRIIYLKLMMRQFSSSSTFQGITSLALGCLMILYRKACSSLCRHIATRRQLFAAVLLLTRDRENFLLPIFFYDIPSLFIITLGTDMMQRKIKYEKAIYFVRWVAVDISQFFEKKDFKPRTSGKGFG